MTVTITALQKQRRDTATNWTNNNPTLLAGEWGIESDTKKFKIGDGSTAWQSLDYVPIPDTNRSLPGNLTVEGNFTVNGTTTTIDTTTLTVEDKNIEIGKVSTPTDTTADGGGLTLLGSTNKTFNWVDATDSWTSSEHLDLASAKVLKVAGTQILSATALGSSVVSSSLTSLGTIATGVWQGTAIGSAYMTAGTTSVAGALQLTDSTSSTSTTTAATPNSVKTAKDTADAAQTTANAALPKAGGQISGNITCAGTETVDGRDLSVDGAKLDGIEASADVTDATNVNAAGAIMESDVDAKGDLLAGTADNTVARLAVGTNGYVLKADSSAATGLAWVVDSSIDGSSLNASNLNSGTVPDARFPATLPALNGSALTDLDGSNVATGTIAAARVATLNQDTTGSAATLTTPRAINGVNFDGSADITVADSTKMPLAGGTFTGLVNFNNGIDLANLLKEGVNITAGKLSDNTNIDLENGMVHLFTTQETTTSTPNIRVSSSTTLDSSMSVGEAITVTIITTAAAAGYSAQLTIDSAAVTENWVGGSAPSDGGSSGVDIHSYTIIKTASATFTVIGNQSKTS
jgi:hypothetical protein